MNNNNEMAIISLERYETLQNTIVEKNARILELKNQLAEKDAQIENSINIKDMVTFDDTEFSAWMSIDTVILLDKLSKVCQAYIAEHCPNLQFLGLNGIVCSELVRVATVPEDEQSTN